MLAGVLTCFTRRRASLLLAGLVGVVLAACTRGAISPAQPPAQPAPSEPFRPEYHFAPAQGWMNDPNGLVYDQGEYHLFYQHNPAATVWGPMHWGHAVSRDLVHWEHLPVALAPDANGAIFSGSAVVDTHNTAGFGAGALVAVFTHDLEGEQRQSLAYSTDRGRTWTKYAGNPVLDAPNHLRNFRDPKVIWYDTGAGTGHWVMLVAAGNIILFYTSPDLKQWEASGGFGLGYGATGGVWETPDLFLLPVETAAEAAGEATGAQHWVLSVGVQAQAPAGGSGTQYFVGDFDGKTFTSLNPKDTVLWADYGADFYAAQGWNHEPQGRAIWAAWLNNWQYANAIPAGSARGALTLPRVLSLVNTPDGLRLRQQPIPALETLRGAPRQWQNVMVTPTGNVLAEVSGERLEILAEIAVDDPTTTATRVGLRLRTGDDQSTTVGYALKGRSLYLDRTQSGDIAFSPDFPGIHLADLDPVNGVVRLHIFVDRTSVEVFANDGLVTLTDLVFPAATSTGLELFADGGNVLVKSLIVHPLDAAH